MSDTTKVTDAEGHEFEVATGADGENPVSVNNPHPKSLQGDVPERPPSQDNASASADEQREVNAAQQKAVDERPDEEKDAPDDTQDDKKAAPAKKSSAKK